MLRNRFLNIDGGGSGDPTKHRIIDLNSSVNKKKRYLILCNRLVDIGGGGPGDPTKHTKIDLKYSVKK